VSTTGEAIGRQRSGRLTSPLQGPNPVEGIVADNPVALGKAEPERATSTLVSFFLCGWLQIATEPLVDAWLRGFRASRRASWDELVEAVSAGLDAGGASPQASRSDPCSTVRSRETGHFGTLYRPHTSPETAYSMMAGSPFFPAPCGSGRRGPNRIA
jgi:hypothetical protein